MVTSIRKSKKIDVYVVYGVKEYTGEVDIDHREGERNEPPNEDNATTYEEGPSNANVEDTNQGSNEAEHDENEVVNKDNKDNEDNEATEEAQR
ncbi:uncharacterized protein A4U43_C07F39560 [Asparagus officinalis]|uniref:Uncharacterized protein n=1 Tax=Asparagus officinalis TaxID=4686 RepID=A0A5P1EKG4_ASPOF|nr:uncharacterized protein A4U43_C07F39560 [Asparagus officinalis]